MNSTICEYVNVEDSLDRYMAKYTKFPESVALLFPVVQHLHRIKSWRKMKLVEVDALNCYVLCCSPDYKKNAVEVVVVASPNDQFSPSHISTLLSQYDSIVNNFLTSDSEVAISGILSNSVTENPDKEVQNCPNEINRPLVEEQGIAGTNSIILAVVDYDTTLSFARISHI